MERSKFLTVVGTASLAVSVLETATTYISVMGNFWNVIKGDMVN